MVSEDSAGTCHHEDEGQGSEGNTPALGFAGESLTLSMVSDDSAATCHHGDKGQSGEYDHVELFAGETLTLSMVSEDSAGTCHHEDEGQGGVRGIRPPLGLKP